MNKETIKCPFCFKESEFGVRVCTGCHSKISYGEVSGWAALLIVFILLAITYIILYISQNLLVGIITFFYISNFNEIIYSQEICTQSYFYT